MARSYSQDLRERVKQAVQEGYSQNSVARMFKIGKATVGRYMARLRKTGNLTPDKMGGYKKSKLAAHTEKVKELIAAEPDQTLTEMQTKLAAIDIKVSVSALDRFLRAMQLTYKKKLYLPRNNIAKMWPESVIYGAEYNQRSIQASWSL